MKKLDDVLYMYSVASKSRPIQEKHTIAHAQAHIEVFRSVINCMHKSNFWPHIFTT